MHVVLPLWVPLQSYGKDHRPDFFFSLNAQYEVTRHGLFIKMTKLTDKVKKE